MSDLPFWDDWHIDDTLMRVKCLEPKCPHKDMIERCRYIQWLKRNERYMRNVLMDTADAILSIDTTTTVVSSVITNDIVCHNAAHSMDAATVGNVDIATDGIAS